MSGIPLENDEEAYTTTGLVPAASHIVEVMAWGSVDNETVETKEMVANGVIIIIPP